MARAPEPSRCQHGRCSSEPCTESPLRGKHQQQHHMSPQVPPRQSWVGLDLLLARRLSRVAHRLSRAVLWSNREFGFSTRIRLMSSTLKCSSRANSSEKKPRQGQVPAEGVEGASKCSPAQLRPRCSEMVLILTSVLSMAFTTAEQPRKKSHVNAPHPSLTTQLLNNPAAPPGDGDTI